MCQKVTDFSASFPGPGRGTRVRTVNLIPWLVHTHRHFINWKGISSSFFTKKEGRIAKKGEYSRVTSRESTVFIFKVSLCDFFDFPCFYPLFLPHRPSGLNFGKTFTYFPPSYIPGLQTRIYLRYQGLISQRTRHPIFHEQRETQHLRPLRGNPLLPAHLDSLRIKHAIDKLRRKIDTFFYVYPCPPFYVYPCPPTLLRSPLPSDSPIRNIALI